MAYYIFLSGYVIKKYFSYNEFYKKWIFVSCLLLFLILSVFWNRIGDPLFSPIIEQQFLWNKIPMLFRKILIKVGYEYSVPFLGIAAICLGVKYINIQPIKRGLEIIGTYTLEIYILHYFFLTLINTKFIFLNVILNSAIALILSLLTSVILEKSRIVGYILFGKSGKKQC